MFYFTFHIFLVRPKFLILPAPRNFHAAEDPFQIPTEYTRALNAAKLNRYSSLFCFYFFLPYNQTGLLVSFFHNAAQ